MLNYKTIQRNMYVAEWDGSREGATVDGLRQAGWTILFQVPEREMDRAWSDAEGKQVDKPAPLRMVIVGPYRWQVWMMNAGQVLVWTEGDDTFNAWNKDIVDSNMVCDDQTPVAFPTPEQLKANSQAPKAAVEELFPV